MKEEPKYPIYFFSARWTQDGEWDEKYPNWHKGLRKGRIWNSIGFSKMFKEEQTQEFLDKYIKDWWKNYKKIKIEIKNPKIKSFKAKYTHSETWHCTWFQHETFDIGQSNEEVLDSFSNYITRIEMHNMRCEEKDQISLMSAEDRWRWHGAEPDGKPTDHSPAPCRCKFCKEQGIIRIAH